MCLKVMSKTMDSTKLGSEKRAYSFLAFLSFLLRSHWPHLASRVESELTFFPFPSLLSFLPPFLLQSNSPPSPSLLPLPVRCPRSSLLPRWTLFCRSWSLVGRRRTPSELEREVEEDRVETLLCRLSGRLDEDNAFGLKSSAFEERARRGRRSRRVERTLSCTFTFSAREPPPLSQLSTNQLLKLGNSLIFLPFLFLLVQIEAVLLSDAVPLSLQPLLRSLQDLDLA